MKRWWRRLHWTTQRDLKLAFWVTLFAAPVLFYVLWDDIGPRSVGDGSTAYAAVGGDVKRSFRGR